jgi:hypothetical protein
MAIAVSDHELGPSEDTNEPREAYAKPGLLPHLAQRRIRGCFARLYRPARQDPRSGRRVLG